MYTTTLLAKGKQVGTSKTIMPLHKGAQIITPFGSYHVISVDYHGDMERATYVSTRSNIAREVYRPSFTGDADVKEI